MIGQFAIFRFSNDKTIRFAVNFKREQHFFVELCNENKEGDKKGIEQRQLLQNFKNPLG
jgi:hypothetical protein